MKCEGWDDPLAKDGWTLSGWLLMSFEVRTEQDIGMGKVHEMSLSWQE